VFNGTAFVETFLDGSQVTYGTVINGWYYISTAQSPAGATHTYTYGSGVEAGLLQTIQVPDGKMVSFVYAAGSPTSLLQSVQDFGGRVWSFQFDAHQDLTTYQTPSGCMTQYTYTPGAGGAVTLISSITDPRGFATSYQYDGNNAASSMSLGTATWSFLYGSEVASGFSGSVQTSPTGALTTYIASGGTLASQLQFRDPKATAVRILTIPTFE